MLRPLSSPRCSRPLFIRSGHYDGNGNRVSRVPAGGSPCSASARVHEGGSFAAIRGSCTSSTSTCQGRHPLAICRGLLDFLRSRVPIARVLRDAVIAHAAANDVTASHRTRFGTRYEIDGRLPTPGSWSPRTTHRAW